jgi:hypothetical protein
MAKDWSNDGKSHPCRCLIAFTFVLLTRCYSSFGIWVVNLVSDCLNRWIGLLLACDWPFCDVLHTSWAIYFCIQCITQHFNHVLLIQVESNITNLFNKLLHIC